MAKVNVHKPVVRTPPSSQVKKVDVVFPQTGDVVEVAAVSQTMKVVPDPQHRPDINPVDPNHPIPPNIVVPMDDGGAIRVRPDGSRFISDTVNSNQQSVQRLTGIEGPTFDRNLYYEDGVTPRQRPDGSSMTKEPGVRVGPFDIPNVVSKPDEVDRS